MKSLFITPKNQSELKFLSELLKKLDIKSIQMEEEEVEDIGLSKLLKNVDMKDRVSKESIMNKLIECE